MQLQSTDNMPGEDTRSIMKHIANMKEEMRKREPNRALLKDAMKRSATNRMQYCQEHTTSEVLEEFPASKVRLLVSTSINFI